MLVPVGAYPVMNLQYNVLRRLDATSFNVKVLTSAVGRRLPSLAQGPLPPPGACRGHGMAWGGVYNVCRSAHDHSGLGALRE